MPLTPDQELELLLLEREKRRRSSNVSQEEKKLKIMGIPVSRDVLNATIQAGKLTQRNLDLSPTGMINKAFGKLREGADIAGEFTAEQFARKGINPNLSAAAGTFVSMAPDIMASLGPTQSSPKNIFSKFGKSLTRRSLGFTKKDFGSSIARKTAEEAADVAIQKKFIPLSGDASIAFRKASISANKAGVKLERLLRSINKRFNVKEAIKEISKLKSRGQGGKFDSINNTVDEGIDTLKAFGDESITFEQAREILTVLRKTIDYGKQNTAKLEKKVAGALMREIEKQVGAAGQGIGNKTLLNQFKNLKREFGASMRAQEGLANRIGSETGNNIFALRTTIPMLNALSRGDVQGSLIPLILNFTARPLQATSAAFSNLLGRTNLPSQLPAISNQLTPREGGVDNLADLLGPSN